MTVRYHSEFYNKMNNNEQWIRLTDGCFRNCWNCYAPTEKVVYDLPKIERNKVRFLDMNFIHAHPDPIGLVKELGTIKVNKKVVYYTFLCGLDFTLFNQELLNEMKKSRVGRFNNKGNYINGMSIAWDRGFIEISRFARAVDMLITAGYKTSNIQVRMLCNGKISFCECVQKLKFLKKLNVQIDDCWYDNQKRGKLLKPIFWTKDECDLFGKLCRAHNIAVSQRMYPALNYLYEVPK